MSILENCKEAVFVIDMLDKYTREDKVTAVIMAATSEGMSTSSLLKENSLTITCKAP